MASKKNTKGAAETTEKKSATAEKAVAADKTETKPETKVEKVAAKVETKVEKAETKTEPKVEKTELKVEKVEEPKVEKKAAKKTESKKENSGKSVSENLYIQHNSNDFEYKDIFRRAKEAWVALGNVEEEIISIDVYVVPNHMRVYYVVNEIAKDEYSFDL